MLTLQKHNRTLQFKSVFQLQLSKIFFTYSLIETSLSSLGNEIFTAIYFTNILVYICIRQFKIVQIYSNAVANNNKISLFLITRTHGTADLRHDGLLLSWHPLRRSRLRVTPQDTWGTWQPRGCQGTHLVAPPTLRYRFRALTCGRPLRNRSPLPGPLFAISRVIRLAQKLDLTPLKGDET